jgi:hypothetical protein
MKRSNFVFLNCIYASSLTILLPAVAFVYLPTTARAATSFSNALTGFTGNSTVPATQTAVGAAGFGFANTAGVDPEFTMDPTVAFDANGATFGSLYGGDGGRNYMRTNESDYATVSFTAGITVTYGALPYTVQQAFFGMGTGEIALFGTPDWSTLVASTWVQPEDSATGDNPRFTTFRSNNDANQFVNHPAPGLGDGTHRIQMTFDSAARTMVYAIDYNYTGTFTADATAPTVDLNHVDCPTGCGNPEMPISADFFGPDGWPTEASSIYFGGDDSVVFKDFSVVVSAAPGQEGDFDGDNDVDGRDFLVWQRGGSPSPLSAGDLSLWQSNYGEGGLVALSAVPEPSSIALLMLSALCCGRGKRK